MDPPPSPRIAPQAVEAGHHHLPRTARPRHVGACRREGGCPWPPLVEERSDGHPHRTANPLLRRTGCAPARRVTSTFRTAGCGPARPVVWEGPGGAKPAAPILIPRQRDRWPLGPRGGVSDAARVSSWCRCSFLAALVLAAAPA